MAYSVYIIYSKTLDRYYVGYTENIAARLIQHNTGFSTYTAKANDWVLKYSELYETRKECLDRERKIKATKSRKYIEELILKK